MKKLLFVFIWGLIFFTACSDDDEITFPSPEINSTAKELNFAYSGGIKKIQVEANTKWNIEADKSWIKLSTKAGEGDATIDVTVDINKDVEPRSGSICIKADGLEDIVISVSQKNVEVIGLYILSEGTWGKKQAEIAYYDFATETILKKVFKTNNGGAVLGDTGNDLEIYGSKMYCIVSGADVESGGGYIEVLDPATVVSKKRIAVTDIDGKADMPRRIVFYQDKGYITTYSGMVARLDTASLTIDAKAKLSGTFPEGIDRYNDKLYVCNSGKGNGTTLSVVDINSFKEEKTINVPKNPMDIKVAANGDIYFSTADFSWATGEKSNLHILDPKTGTVSKTLNRRAYKLTVSEDYLYTVETDYVTYGGFTTKVNLKTQEASCFTTELPKYFMAYAVNVNPINDDVYILGQGQDVAIFDKDGSLKTKLKTGTGFGNKVVPYFR